MNRLKTVARWLACEFDGHNWLNVNQKQYTKAAQKLLDVLDGKREIDETPHCLKCFPEACKQKHGDNPLEYIRLMEDLLDAYEDVPGPGDTKIDHAHLLVYRQQRFGKKRLS